MTFRIASPAPGARQLSAALDRAAEAEPELARRAREALAGVLAPTAASRLGDAAWGCSGLTPSGFPVELTVSSARAELRWVAEVQAPESDPASAVPVAVAACGDGLTPDQLALVDRLHLDQRRAQGLRFGAWLAGRHAAGREVRKIYLEVPAGTVAPGADRLSGLATPRFLGLTADRTGTVELYARVHPGLLHPLEQIVQRTGLPIPGDALGRRLARWAREVPSHALSVSLSLVEAEVTGVAAFTFLHRIAPHDDAVRRAVLAASTAGDWPSRALYERLSAPLSGIRSSRLHHGPLSLVHRADGSEETHVGLAPPPVPVFQPQYREVESCHA